MDNWERLVHKLMNAPKKPKIPEIPKIPKIPWLMNDPNNIYRNYLTLV